MSSIERLLVQKFGGSSLATAERIRAAAARVHQLAVDGQPVVVVVSAMGDTTDELISLAYQVSHRPHERELDLLLSTGETVSATLFAMALHDLHQSAVALTAAQAGIRSTRADYRYSPGPHPRRARPWPRRNRHWLSRCDRGYGRDHARSRRLRHYRRRPRLRAGRFTLRDTD